MEDDSYMVNQAEPYITSATMPSELLDKIREPIRSEVIKWDEARFQEIDELRNRAVQMEKTMKWWSDCTANWREKWGKVRAERNRAREQCKSLQIKLEAALKDCTALKLNKQDINLEYGKVLQELSRLQGTPTSSLECKRVSRAADVDMDSSYAPSSEDRGSEPSLQSEIHFIEDVLKTTEQHYTSRPPSACSEHVRSAWLRSPEERRMSRDQEFDHVTSSTGVDLTKLKQLLEETQRHLHDERNSKIALSQSAEIYCRENAQLKKKADEYKRQKCDALEELSRIQLESGDKLARLSLEIEGESESRSEMDKKIKDMRADVQRLTAENATEWARRERLETEKCALERENKNLRLQIQEAEETICRRNTNPINSPEYKTLHADLYQRNKELEMLKTTHSRTKKQLNEKSGELEHCQKKLDVLEDDVYTLRKRVEELKKEVIAREDEVDMRNNQIRKLHRNCEELTEHNDTLQAQLNSLETRLRQRTDAMFNTTQRSPLEISDEEDFQD